MSHTRSGCGRDDRQRGGRDQAAPPGRGRPIPACALGKGSVTVQQGDQANLKVHGAWASVTKPIVLTSTPSRASPCGEGDETRPSGKPEGSDWSVTAAVRQEVKDLARLSNVPGFWPRPPLGVTSKTIHEREGTKESREMGSLVPWQLRLPPSRGRGAGDRRGDRPGTTESQAGTPRAPPPHSPYVCHRHWTTSFPAEGTWDQVPVPARIRAKGRRCQVAQSASAQCRGRESVTPHLHSTPEDAAMPESRRSCWPDARRAADRSRGPAV